MATKKEIAKSLGMKYTTYLRRLEKNIPMDRPFRSKPGGNYKIDESLAKNIWADLKGGKYYNTHQQIADKHNVPKSIVNNIACGRCWNEVTGLEKKIYEEDLS